MADEDAAVSELLAAFDTFGDFGSKPALLQVRANVRIKAVKTSRLSKGMRCFICVSR